MPTHYERLGVRPDAHIDDIRLAYRALARTLHPDAVASGSAAGRAGSDMAAVNEAWRVLSDPARRAMYDASLRGAPPTVRPSGSRSAHADVEAVLQTRSSSSRFPKWPFVLLFALAALFIVTAGALTQPSKAPGPDNLLYPGSCVTIVPNGDAAEVGCEAPHDAVVVTVVNFDETCPMETEARRDRQGRGYACLRR